MLKNLHQTRVNGVAVAMVVIAIVIGVLYLLTS